MHFVFEQFDEQNTVGYNFVNCTDVNPSGIRRFTPSPIFISTYFLRTRPGPHREFAKDVTYSTEPIEGKPYIIATGVTHSPAEWCGPDHQGVGANNAFPDRVSLFEHIPQRYLKDLQSQRAFLLLDQSHEGYQTPWMWEWFHNNCNHYNIDPKQIIYVTGNLDCADQYTEWADSHQLQSRILPLPYAHFENMIFETANEHNKLPTFNDHIKHKTENLANVKVYNALQKRPRAHRAWLFNELHKANLLNDGFNSMNEFKLINTYFEGKQMREEEYDAIRKFLPMAPAENPADTTLGNFVSSDSGSYLRQFNENIMLNSWVTVISEASFGDEDYTCFISEKTFKPIACSHPFIIAGNKHSLKRLKEMGYETFSPFINESYDALATWERLDAILKEVSRIKNMSNDERLNWFKDLEPIFEHNRNIFYKNNRVNIDPSIVALKKYING